MRNIKNLLLNQKQFADLKLFRSGIRESNSFHSLGKAGHSRYTNPAQSDYATGCPWPQASVLECCDEGA